MLTLQLKKHADGRTAFSLLRADGSRTWQRQERHAAFFAAHDLTHYAVETVLGLRGAFYGLVAMGWDFDDFLPPYPRGPLPDEALYAERLVGLLDVERAQSAAAAAPIAASDLNSWLDAKYEPGRAPRQLSDGEVADILERRRQLIRDWEALPSGETLSLPFPR